MPDVRPGVSEKDSRDTLSEHDLKNRNDEEIEQTASNGLSFADEGHSTTVFHIYHEKEHNYFLSPREPSKKRGSIFLRGRKFRCRDSVLDKNDKSDKLDCFFLQTPYLSFHWNPRVLRQGSLKTSKPICLIHSTFLWRRYTIQVGESLQKPGVIDPRGVVPLKHSGDHKNKQTALKGYRVRTWRLWGENGKAFHREVNAARKAQKQRTVAAATSGEFDVSEKCDPIESEETQNPILKAQDLEDGEERAEADTVVTLRWKSPFSNNTRRYDFHYAGLDFTWRGTGTVKDRHILGFFTTFNHLKLLVKVAVDSTGKETSEGNGLNRIWSKKQKNYRWICLAKYTSSVTREKAGLLQIFDTAIAGLWRDYIREQVQVKAVQDEREGSMDSLGSWSNFANTPLYRVVIASAMCMIIAEFQKRKLTIEILQEAAENAGG